MKTNDKNKRPGGKPSGGKGKPYSGPRKDKPAFDARRGKAAKPEKKENAGNIQSEGVSLPPERISKLLARAGVASRRDVERMIVEGRVALNGKVLESPAINVTLSDKIEVDGEPVKGIERTRLWLYHKPLGLVTTNSDPEGRPTVFDNLPEGLPRVMSIGRLDINTEGLLLLTNDGGLARALELPTTGWLRRYRVRAHGSISQPKLDALKDGIAVDGVLYGSIEATLDREQGSNVWLTMGLREGKNREIKNVLGALGLEVTRLIRISYGPFQLGNLKEGTTQEVRSRMLRDQLGTRLIEQAGANFDAPIFDHTGSVVADDEVPDKAWKPAEKKQPRERSSEKRSFGNKPFDKPFDKRERALDRLDTKRGEAGAEKKNPLERRSRASNAWMAPGAKPLGPKKKAKQSAPTKQGGRPQEARDGGKPGVRKGKPPLKKGNRDACRRRIVSRAHARFPESRLGRHPPDDRPHARKPVQHIDA